MATPSPTFLGLKGKYGRPHAGCRPRGLISPFQFCCVSLPPVCSCTWRGKVSWCGRLFRNGDNFAGRGLRLLVLHMTSMSSRCHRLKRSGWRCHTGTHVQGCPIRSIRPDQGTCPLVLHGVLLDLVGRVCTRERTLSAQPSSSSLFMQFKIRFFGMPAIRVAPAANSMKRS